MEFWEFIHYWGELIGAFGGVFVAVVGAFLVSWNENRQKTIAERKKQYSNLLVTLQNIHRFISKCELYLNFSKKNPPMIPYEKITINEEVNYINPTQVFDLDSEVYTSIDQVYSVAKMIVYNSKISEVLEINVEKTKKGEVHRQKNVISNRYGENMSLIRYYLPDIYCKYNMITKEIKKLQGKYRYLKFPKAFKIYREEYIENKISEYGLERYPPN